MLAVIKELENQKHLLESTRFKFKVWTNHKNLKIFHESIEVKQKTSLLNMIFVKIQLCLKTHTREKDKKVDKLSRRLDQKVRIEKIQCKNIKR